MPRMFRGASTRVRRQRVSQGCSHTKAQAVGNGLSLRMRATAPAQSPAPARATYPGTFTWAGQSVSQGTDWPTPAAQRWRSTWEANSSENVERAASSASPASQPMAQSEPSQASSARACRRARSSSVARQSNTRRAKTAAWGSPSRHGTHLPQVCEAAHSSSVVVTATGHVPGGVAARRRPKRSRNACSGRSCTARASMESRFIGTLSLLDLLGVCPAKRLRRSPSSRFSDSR